MKTEAEKQIINNTITFVKQNCINDFSGHDFSHIVRVHKMTLYIAKKEGIKNSFCIEMAALLHDTDDYKNGGDIINLPIATSWLNNLNINEKNRIVEIIKSVSYSHNEKTLLANDIEKMIVRDADRLDAIGAIGIARAFAYGGNKKRLMYDHNNTLNKTTTINHFHDKLLNIYDLLNTKTAKQIGKQRHNLTLQFLKKFNNDINSKFY